MLKPQPARYTKPDEMANIIIFALSPKLRESLLYFTSKPSKAAKGKAKGGGLGMPLPPV